MHGAGNLPRRRFIEVAASGAVATVGCGGPGSSYRFFSDAEAATLAALCDQIIPPDQDPGASQAGIVRYIDTQLSGFYRKHRSAYRSGLIAIDVLAQEHAGQRFAQLSSDRQCDLLTSLEARTIGDNAGRAFFAMAIRHTLEGFYGNPRHGGNRNFASWRMLGIPPAPVRGRQVNEGSAS